MSMGEENIQAIWEKGRGTNDRDASIWRRDECGAWIRREHYGHETSEYGWKIEVTVAGGGDELDYLRPFHRDNGFDPNTGQARCAITADREAIQPTAQVDTPHNRAV